MENKIIKSKKAQVSLEFSFLFLAILLASIITISHFLSQNFTKDDKVISDVENAAKTAVILANSGYNGINPNVTLIYGGISWSGNKKNIYIYISPKSYITPEIKNFIVSYIYNVTKINQSEYNITVNP
ncbi:TPA: class III signal peptide-containing protein [Methanocaldococcus jannaschii]|nr:class III signal peptide-containing protein [Methanocaldococcus jannaschii]HII59003.1 class III signal peptide-containing protein [Methanocaldococcus jannaschii]